ncbi:hypothetical protein AAFC00_006730 [Neodothiora populina]|uniref:Uncharacterized protein n=1 Tax=Neodothiora populina TaxID=2781224 RepID=A0ABR3PAZ6_9PEZI
MAGNPFRRPGTIPPTPPTRQTAAELSVETSDASVKAKKVVKRVRIQSPVTSPIDVRGDPFALKLNEAGRASSPPLEDKDSDVATELRKSFIDSVAKGASNLNREVVGVPLQHHPSALGLEATANKSAQPQAPYNPFSRTLASIEGGYGMAASSATKDKAENPGPLSSHGQNEPGKEGLAKPTMDVDSFTRMLMTGSTTASPAPASPAPTSSAVVPSTLTVGTGTAASLSDSQGSMFQQVHDIHPESPRSPTEDSTSDVDNVESGDQASLMGNPQNKKAKPPPPAHHRGKLLSRQGPQTVSFADFDTSISVPSAQQSPSTSAVEPQNTRSSRSSSDVNKPLPLPPSSAGIHNGVDGAKDGMTALPPQPEPPVEIDLQSKKTRAPPPPPTSRRASHLFMGAITGRARSASQLSKSSVPDDLDGDSDQMELSSTQPSNKPPAPPSRRAANSVSSVDREPSVSAAPHGSAEPAVPPPAGRAPPPPPSRQALRGTPALTRTPSTQSASSLGVRRISPSLAQTGAPPPPPPRRGDKRPSFDEARRPSNSSQRSSVELRRSSGAASHNGRTSSISSLHYVPEGGSAHDDVVTDTPTTLNANGKDILADLSAFQAEIDALRAQIGQ